MAILLAAASGDTVKILDPTGGDGGQSALECCPSPDFQLNCVRWNHTNMVVAIAGEDRKISLWSPKLQSVTSIQGDALSLRNLRTFSFHQEIIHTINFSNKSSRYLCSGGSGKIVKIWDMQKGRCIKSLKGHVDTITDTAYNCRDEQVASVSLRGDLMLHSLQSGSRVAELMDPHKQVLRVLDFSRLSRHLLVTSGDDGSVHLWDTTARNPKVSWIKQHLAPTSAVLFSPHNDKMIISVGLDKKLYIYDTGVKRPVHCLSCDSWYSSATFKDDDTIIATGTSNGRVIFYDVRAKPLPTSVLRCFPQSRSVTSLSFQRSNPVHVDEKKMTLEMALLGLGGEEPVIMPDPQPTNSEVRSTMENVGRPPTAPGPSTGEETPIISRLSSFKGVFDSRNDMEVFSPLVEVQPFISSTAKQWDFMAESLRLLEASAVPNQFQTPPPATILNNDRSPSVTPPEAWGGEGGVLPPRVGLRVQPSRFSGISSATASFSGSLKKEAPLPTSSQAPPLSADSQLPSASQASVLSSAPPSPISISDFQPSISAANSIDQDGGKYYLALENFHSPPSEKRDADGLDNDKASPSTTHNRHFYNQSSPEPAQGTTTAPNSFALHLVQRALEESLSEVQRSIHEDVHNLHLELLRQFHMQQKGMEEVTQKMLKNQAELMEQIQTLRKENQELRQHL